MGEFELGSGTAEPRWYSQIELPEAESQHVKIVLINVRVSVVYSSV